MVHFALPISAVASALCSLALLSSTAEAHTVLREPLPCYKAKIVDKHRMDPISFPLEDGHIKDPEERFLPWLKKKGYANLRAFMDDDSQYKLKPDANFKCGWTETSNCPPRAIPNNSIVRTSGYMHNGPCALYLDDKLVSSADNCRLAFPNKNHCIDFSSCVGTCTLYWFWLGERDIDEKKLRWQVYKACVPLTTGGKKWEPSKTCTPIGAAPPSYGAAGPPPNGAAGPPPNGKN